MFLDAQDSLQQQLAIRRVPLPASNRCDPHESIAGFGSQLILQQFVQGLKRLDRRDDRKLRSNAFLQHIHQAMGFRRQELLKVVANQGRTEAPDSGAQLQLSTFRGSSFAQGTGDKKKVAHVRDERCELAGVAASRTRVIRQHRKARRDLTPGASQNTMTSDMFSGTFADENQWGTQWHRPRIPVQLHQLRLVVPILICVVEQIFRLFEIIDVIVLIVEAEFLFDFFFHFFF